MYETKYRTRKILTLYALEKRFVTTGPRGQKPALDTGYLNHTIQLMLKNDEICYKAMLNRKRKARAVVWEAFTAIADDAIKDVMPRHADPDTVYYASSSHLKEFLNLYGNGYDTLKESVKYVEQERKRIREEKENAEI